MAKQPLPRRVLADSRWRTVHVDDAADAGTVAEQLAAEFHPGHPPARWALAAGRSLASGTDPVPAGDLALVDITDLATDSEEHTDGE